MSFVLICLKLGECEMCCREELSLLQYYMCGKKYLFMTQNKMYL